MQVDGVMHVVLASPAQDVRAHVRKELEERFGNQVAVEESDTLSRALERTLAAKPVTLFMDLSSTPDETLNMIPSLRAGAPNTRVVLLYDPLHATPGTDQAQLFLEALRRGVFDFLRVPVAPTDMERLVRRLRDETASVPTDAGKTAGTVATLFSHKGGVGKTTIAVNLAVLLAQNQPGQVALVDGSFQLGNVREFLAVEPQFTFYDAARNLARLDGDMLRGLMTFHEASQLYVLDTPRKVEQCAAIKAEHATQVLLAMRTAFKYVVVDTYPVFNAISLAIADLSELLYVVTEAIVPTVKGTKLLLDIFSEAGYPTAKSRIVLNRYAHFRGNLDPEMITATLQRPIDYVLPYDKLLHESANRGVPLALSHPARPFSRGIARIVRELGGGTAEAPKKSWLQALLGTGRA